MIEAAETLGEKVGTSAACRALGVPRSTLYRARNPKTASGPRPAPPRALSQDEKAAVRAELNSERFCDYAPREVYSTLLDEDTYYCHWRTMYRIQEEHGEVRERRDQCRRIHGPGFRGAIGSGFCWMQSRRWTWGRSMPSTGPTGGGRQPTSY